MKFTFSEEKNVGNLPQKQQQQKRNERICLKLAFKL